MSNQQQLVSVIVPCYKQAEFLAEALDSVLVQQYQNWECIIVNDGSPDLTDEVAQFYLAKDARFKYLKQENSGLAAARNAGIKISSGKYILPLDADDRIGPEYLTEAVMALNNDNELKLVYCRSEFFGEQCGEWMLQDYSPERLLTNNIIFCSAIFRRIDFDRIGGYDGSFRYSGHEDWDFWISILLPEGKVLKLPKILFFYRIRHNSMIHSLSSENVITNGFKIYEKHKDMYLRFWGSPQKYLAENLKLKDEMTALLKSPRIKIANLLFFPVDLLRSIHKAIIKNRTS
jgi:glycosyltransferase involved in cell wall biosynthesis